MTKRMSSPRNTFIDHFYNDEADKSFTPPPQTNIFNNGQFTFQIDQKQADNPIEAAEQAKLNLPSRKAVDANYYIFVPEGTRKAAEKEAEAGEKLTVMVSLLFAVRDQFNRAGLRSFFAKRDDAVLITVPGRETGNKRIAWGIGISDAQIESLLKQAFGSTDVLYEIAVIAAYSTGYRGMQGTILENAKNKFITLTHVKKMIYYDCLYKADGKPPGGYPPGERTEDAVRTLLAANPAAKLSIYEVTDGGTIRYGKSLAVNVQGQNVINLKPLARELTTLQYARLLDEAQRDGIITNKDVPATIKALFPLPARGSVTSDRQFMAPGKVMLRDWASNNAMAVSKAQADLASIDQIIYNEFLMGWHPPTAGDVRAEARHDQFMPEFSWELLPP
ncbi:MAG: hypothetical protein PHO08_15685 [Methylococcales bacterium]|nr:hypothetical protein [Methylococcales bacterium]MDD5631569.1 hypothetical protein [Methylococcales bacterium]